MIFGTDTGKEYEPLNNCKELKRREQNASASEIPRQRTEKTERKRKKGQETHAKIVAAFSSCPDSESRRIGFEKVSELIFSS